MSAKEEFEIMIQDYDEPVQQWAASVTELVLSVRPEARLELERSWGGYLLFKTPVEGGNSVCFVSAHKKHVSLGFSEGAKLEDPSGILEGKGKLQRHLKIKRASDLEKGEIRTLLEQAWARQPDSDVQEAAIKKVREICLAYPGSSETISHGHPTFKVKKKTFAVYGIYSPSVAFKATPSLHGELEGDERFFPTPYMAHKGWLSVRVDQDTDWKQVKELVDHSFQQVTTRK